MLAKDLMSRNPLSVTKDTNLRRAIQVMLDAGISGLPVTDGDGRICGMLTESDVLQRSELNLAPDAPPTPHDPGFFERYVKSHARTVADCMSFPVITAKPDTSLFAIVGLMRKHSIKRIPIVENTNIVGIASRRDVLRAVLTGRDVIAEGDEAIRLAARTRLKTELGLDAGQIGLRVENSVVEVIGTLEPDLKRQAVGLVIESIAGVAGVKFVTRERTAAKERRQ